MEIELEDNSRVYIIKVRSSPLCSRAEKYNDSSVQAIQSVTRTGKDRL